jgi:hypothetical protein
MVVNDRIGEPIPKGIIGDSAPIIDDDAYGNDRRSAESEAQLKEIREELRQLRHTIGELAEATTKYARNSVQDAAQTAVDRYPIGSIVLAALAGYWLAGRGR